MHAMLVTHGPPSGHHDKKHQINAVRCRIKTNHVDHVPVALPMHLTKLTNTVNT